ncbi:MAG: hypothetical protein V4485_00670 [Pseudomonadota bacterium]
MLRFLAGKYTPSLGQKLVAAATVSSQAYATRHIEQCSEYHERNQGNATYRYTKELKAALNEADCLFKQGWYKEADLIYATAQEAMQSAITEYEQHLGNMLRAHSIAGNKQDLEELVARNLKYFRAYKDPDTGNTTLHTLLEHRMYDSAKLVATEESCGAKNNDGYTPVHVAFENEGLGFVQDTLLPTLSHTQKLPMDNVMSGIIRTSLYADDHFIELVGQLFDTNA